MSFVLPANLRTFFGFDGARPFARSSGPKREAAARFLMFDAYYCCLLLGLDARRLGDETNLESDKFIDGYPDSFKGQAELIAGLLVDAELGRLEIGPDDRDDIEREMVRLLDLTSVTRLSTAGDNLLNRYAVTGFDRLRDAMLPPDNLEDFLVGYHELWDPTGDQS
ncbi:hypothetical protein [Mesorhizobium sp.]|uniref:hypothetical protein n=1 Tax=Mesorhizobium sp. TaxID=1871066 RepID=UPI000FE98749|nr:hypothetical protein [Mesorhizobium sp.]RWO22201.1 MAG: hypothetical protein EOS09_21445 [Mesorhizobium sp.]